MLVCYLPVRWIRRVGLVLPAVLTALLLGGPPAAAQVAADPPAPSDLAAADSAMARSPFRIFTSFGEPATLDAVVAAMQRTDVVLIGEVHNDSVAHALQAELLEQAYARYAETRPLALSLEMFERDVQYILDEYLDDHITETHFLASSRPWNNYAADYRPLVEFAKAHGMPVLAANAPRRYVNRVLRLGPESLDALGADAQALLPPLPAAAPTEAYRHKWNRLMGSHGDGAASDTTQASESQSAHATTMGNYLEAQNLWDASMAYAVAQHLMRAPRALVLHLTGAFHVEGGTGTPDHLTRYRPGTRTLTVVLRPEDPDAVFQTDLHAGLGDFVIFTDATLLPESSGAF